jgi:hypothetical protein
MTSKKVNGDVKTLQAGPLQLEEFSHNTEGLGLVKIRRFFMELHENFLEMSGSLKEEGLCSKPPEWVETI